METQMAADLEYERLILAVKDVTAGGSDLDAAIIIRRAVKKELAAMLAEKAAEKNAKHIDEAFGEIGQLWHEPSETALEP